ncbi:hypothetical protein BDZ45DRAFT_584334, partial [Acephala macrosclerotiorum]
IVIKVINDLIELDSIVFTLLVFEIYFKMTSNDTSSLSVIKRIETIRVITKKVRRLYIQR